ncbi:spore cortex biosynthesis protein YabQ [Desulforamulus putei]|uniref:Spore cortex biosynthesis protein YabQ n=1 Tax=Desulforamulus putei DSM 12395 TaxID=1121429 RepID=A0A1M5B9C1_9FIRM|nr:spore cortex biosynthesis protein YabQ [Desulforamulus putei]SHF39020.1 spore cortex biosynthesis protein YabQ [Desulforamulus putei DSM 12395]
MVPLMDQFYYFALTIIIGMVAGFCYDLYRVTRGTLRLRRIGTALGDLLFWFVLTGVVFVLLLLGNWGEVRLYVLLGLALGAVIYLSVFSRRTTSMIRWTFRALHQLWVWFIKSLSFAWRMLCLPFRGVYLLVALPLGFVAGVTGKVLKGTGTVLNKLLGSPGRRIKKGFKRRISSIFPIFEYKDPE